MPSLRQSSTKVPESDSQEEPLEEIKPIPQPNKKQPQQKPEEKEKKDYRDIPVHQAGPGQLVVAKKSTKNPKLHIRLMNGICVGCGWKPTPGKVEVLNTEQEYLQERLSLTQCSFCFKRYCIPAIWGLPPTEVPSSDSSDSSESDSRSQAESDTDTA